MAENKSTGVVEEFSKVDPRFANYGENMHFTSGDLIRVHVLDTWMLCVVREVTGFDPAYGGMIVDVIDAEDKYYRPPYTRRDNFLELRLQPGIDEIELIAVDYCKELPGDTE